jgi:hypothetical protein
MLVGGRSLGSKLIHFISLFVDSNSLGNWSSFGADKVLPESRPGRGEFSASTLAAMHNAPAIVRQRGAADGFYKLFPMLCKRMDPFRKVA